MFLFSGQGSQYFHMGRALYDEDATFREWMTRLDELARRLSGHSVIDVLYSDAHAKGDRFDRTLLTHPAIFMVEYSLAQSLIQAGVNPDMVLGASLGSFTAAAVAGFLDVEAALAAVIRQAAALEEWGEPGGMLAILAKPALFSDSLLRDRSELAAIDFDTHFIVSARSRELGEIEESLKVRGVDIQRLPVSFPFHSRWIDRARIPFESFMQSVRRAPGRLPLVCCCAAEVLSDIPDGYFWNVVRSPIRFQDTVARLEQLGAHRYIDVGPAGTLATFLKYALPAGTGSTVHSILTPYGWRRNPEGVSVSEMLTGMRSKTSSCSL